MKKHLGRALTVFLIVCFPLHALLRMLGAKNESEIANFPFFGTACFIGFALIGGGVASLLLLSGLQEAVTIVLATVLYGAAMIDYFHKVLKARGGAA